MKYATPHDRLIANSVPAPDSDCWLWTGSYNNVGRPRISVRDKGDEKARWEYVTQYIIYRVHRQIARRKNIKGLHSCDNSACVNPAHITRGTQKRNIRDAVKRGRHVSGFTVHKQRKGAKK